MDSSHPGHVIATHRAAPTKGQGQQKGNQGVRKTLDDSSSDTVTTTESRTSSSEDEVVSQVSIRMGLNPCKCLTCEGCDLRNHCVFIGILEMIFWLLFIVLVVLLGLMSRGSEPEILKGATGPDLSARGVRVKVASAVVTKGPREDSEDPSMRLLNDNDMDKEGSWTDDHELGGSTTLPSTTDNYEVYLRNQVGDAMILLKPNTRDGVDRWQINLHKHLVAMSVTFSAVVVLSTLAGGICYVGAHYVSPLVIRKTCNLLVHSGLASFTSLTMLALGVQLALMKCYFQFLLCVIGSVMYIYFAVCTYGLVSVIMAGYYDDFVFEGINYTYSTVLRANVQTLKARDGHLDTIHPNEQ